MPAALRVSNGERSTRRTCIQPCMCVAQLSTARMCKVLFAVRMLHRQRGIQRILVGLKSVAVNIDKDRIAHGSRFCRPEHGPIHVPQIPPNLSRNDHLRWGVRCFRSRFEWTVELHNAASKGVRMLLTRVVVNGMRSPVDQDRQYDSRPSQDSDPVDSNFQRRRAAARRFRGTWPETTPARTCPITPAADFQVGPVRHHQPTLFSGMHHFQGVDLRRVVREMTESSCAASLGHG